MNGLALRMERIDELSQLETGWLGNAEGKRINPEVVAIVRSLVSSLDKSMLPLPAIFPMADEPGMSLAWRFPAMNVTLRIYSTEEIELSRFNPCEGPQTRRENRQNILFGSTKSAEDTLRCWLKDK